MSDKLEERNPVMSLKDILASIGKARQQLAIEVHDLAMIENSLTGNPVLGRDPRHEEVEQTVTKKPELVFRLMAETKETLKLVEELTKIRLALSDTIGEEVESTNG